MRKLLEKIEDKKSLWDKYGGVNNGIDNFLTVMGFNPNVKRPEKKRGMCPECGKAEVVTVEDHPDTEMNCMVHRCKACGYEKEL